MSKFLICLKALPAKCQYTICQIIELVLGFTVLGESKHNDVMLGGHSAPCSVLINTITGCPPADHEWELAVAGGSALTASVAPAAS